MNELNEEFIRIIKKIDEDSKLPGSNLVDAILRREMDIDDLHSKVLKEWDYKRCGEQRSVFRGQISKHQKSEIERLQLAFNVAKSFIDKTPGDLAVSFVPILKSYIKGALLEIKKYQDSL